MNDILINLKAKLGITSSIRDSYLEFIISGVKNDLRGKGIKVFDEYTTSLTDERVNSLIVDISFCRYKQIDLTKNIESRIKDLIMRDCYGN